MFCQVCGKELNENAVICTGCGCSTSQESSKVKHAQRNGGELNFFKFALIMAIVSAFPLLCVAFYEEQLICSFVLSMIFITTSIIFASLGLLLEKTITSKTYCTTAILLDICSFVCVLVFFVCCL